MLHFQLCASREKESNWQKDDEKGRRSFCYCSMTLNGFLATLSDTHPRVDSDLVHALSGNDLGKETFVKYS
jgi:hypothetical protein